MGSRYGDMVDSHHLYASRQYTFVNGNTWNICPDSGTVRFNMRPGDNLVMVDTETGIPQPLAMPPTAQVVYPVPYPHPTMYPGIPYCPYRKQAPTYPIAPAPVDIYLPERGLAAGKWYTIRGYCLGEAVNIYDDETKTLLGSLATGGTESLTLYCDGVAWFDDQMVQLIP